MGISKSRMREYYDRYNNQPHRTLNQVYNVCSERKRSAWESIRERMVSQDGHGLTVLGYGGSWSYSTGYVYNDEQGRKHFVVDTRDNMEDVLVSEL